MGKISRTVIGIMLMACIIIAATIYFNVQANTKPDVISTMAAQNSTRFELNIPLPTIIDPVMEYKVNNAELTQEYMKDISNIFNFNMLDSTKGNDKIIEDGRMLKFYKTGGFLYASHSGFVGDEPTNLPCEQDAIEIAKKYLESKNLIPEDVGSAYVTPIQIDVYYPTNNTTLSYTLAWTVHFNRTINGLRVYGAGQNLIVDVSDNGKITGAQKLWRDVSPNQIKKIKTPDQAYAELVQSNNGTIIVPATNADKVIITDVSIGYYIEEGDVSQQLVDPVYVFKGDEVIGDVISKGTYEAYVKAI